MVLIIGPCSIHRCHINSRYMVCSRSFRIYVFKKPELIRRKTRSYHFSEVVNNVNVEDVIKMLDWKECGSKIH